MHYHDRGALILKHWKLNLAIMGVCLAIATAWVYGKEFLFQVSERVLDRKDPKLAMLYEDRAKGAKTTAEAVSYLRKALYIREHAFGHSDASLVPDLEKLADYAYEERNSTENAIMLLHRALKIELVSKLDDLEIASIHNKLGNCFRRLKDSDRALESYQMSLACLERKAGVAAQETRKARRDLAVYLFSLKKTEAGLELLRSNVNSLRNNSNPKGDVLGDAITDLAGNLSQVSDSFAERESLYKESYEIFSQSSHSHVKQRACSQLRELGKLYLEHGDLQKSACAYLRAIEIAEVTYGRNSPILFPSLRDYANVLEKLNRLDEAELVRKRAESLPPVKL